MRTTLSRCETVFTAAQVAFEVSQSAFYQRRTKLPVAARAAAMYYLCRQEEIPLVRIGEALGRDHTTVMHHREHHAGRMLTDPLYRQGYERLLRLLKQPRPDGEPEA